MAGSKRRRVALLATTAVGLVAIVVVAVFATQVAHPNPTAASPLLGRNAPAVSGKNLLGGGNESLYSLRGRFVLVSFFASWCAPCNSEAPQLESFAFEHRSDASVLGVVFDDSAGNASAFLRHFGATWAAVMDPNASFAISYGVANPPQSFLIAPSGQVVAWFPGAVSEKSLDAELQRAKANGA